MARVPVGKVLLRNLMRHTGAHNKVGPDPGRDRNVENQGVGEADRRDILEEAKQDAVGHLQVGTTCVEDITVLAQSLNPFAL
uniref:Uncharacterized protein n=1 Tax=Anas platyrhynchos platyrhynchos TaxID=8840 RepID=A0A493SZT8_ANAPP